MHSADEAVGSRGSLETWGLGALAWLVYGFLLMPIVVVIPMSFGTQYAFEFPPRALSLYLYGRLFRDPSWMSAVWLSVRVAGLATLLSLGLGVPAAYSLVRGRYPGRRVITLFLLSPILIPVIVIAFAMYLYFARLHLIGSFAGLVLAHTVYTLPFVLVTCLAGMRHVDIHLESAASVMGAGRLTIFRRITLPLLRPAMVVGGLFAFLMSFDEVVIAFFVVQTTSMTVPVKMYGSMQHDTSPILAAVASVLTFVSMGVCALGAWASSAARPAAARLPLGVERGQLS
jgi:putative spermidine/putrescine transport system permease protein